MKFIMILNKVIATENPPSTVTDEVPPNTKPPPFLMRVCTYTQTQTNLFWGFQVQPS